MHRARAIAAIWILWLGTAAALGFLAAVILNGHGSFVVIPLAVSVGFLGAIACSALIVTTPLARAHPIARISFASAVASSLMVGLAVWGVVAKAEYTLVEAVLFAGPFFVGAVAVASVAEGCILRPFWKGQGLAT